MFPVSQRGGLQTGQASFRDGRDLPAPYTGLQTGARIGDALVIGNFGSRLLVVGIALQDVNGVTDAGLLGVFSFSGSVLSQTTAVFTAADVGGVIETSARFGQSLATGDFSGDGKGDLAVSAPNQTISGISAAGAVYLLFGSGGLAGKPGFLGTGGFVAAAAQRITAAEIGAGRQANGHFGASLTLTSANTMTAADINRDGQADLVIGAPDMAVGNDTATGIVAVRYGVKVGVSALVPTDASVHPGDQISYTLTWTHPQRWRDLGTLHLRLSDDDGVVAWARFDEQSGHFTLLISTPAPSLRAACRARPSRSRRQTPPYSSRTVPPPPLAPTIPP